MLQIPFSALGFKGLDTPLAEASAGLDRAGSDSFSGLLGLLLGEGLGQGLGQGQAPDLSQRLAERLPPEMLQEIEAAIAGGMTLPQVANMIRPRLELMDAELRGALDRMIRERQLPIEVAVDQRSTPDGRDPGRLPSAAIAERELPLVAEPRVRELFESLRWPASEQVRELAKGQPTAEFARLLPSTDGVLPPLARAVPLDFLPQGVLETLKQQFSPTADRHLQLPLRLGEQGWGQALADRIGWLVGRGQQAAELRLNPPNLGPLEVKVAVHQDQASVTFVSQHAAVREAIEAALPRLREMFGQQDLQLVQVDVGQGEAGTGQSRPGRGAPQQEGHSAAGDQAESDQENESVAAQQTTVGLLDLYV